MTGGRRLSKDEAALWAALAKTVKPLAQRSQSALTLTSLAEIPAVLSSPETTSPKSQTHLSSRQRLAQTNLPAPPISRRLDRHGLDASWDRRLSKGLCSPDATLDLHGASLTTAHTRLEAALEQALEQGARLMLVITGKLRPADDQLSRGGQRGAIRAKLPDWLANSANVSRVAALRGAHRRHGGPGAVYIVLRRG